MHLRNQTVPSVPQLLRSSEALGWPDIEVRAYQEPVQSDRWAEPVSPDVSIVLLTQGLTYMGECDRESCKGYSLRQGDLMLKAASSLLPDLHWQTLSQEAVHTLRLNLKYSLFARTVEELADRDPAGINLATLAGFQDPLLLHIGLTLAHELESPSPISPLYAQTAAQMLVVHLLRTYALDRVRIAERQNGLTREQVKRVTEYVQAYLTRPLSLEELAGQIGFSPYHFARLFRQKLGESPHQFVLRQRVEHAQRLLKNMDLTLAQVAVESGFADQSHLTQTFKRYTGVTPKAFRRARFS